MCWRHTVPNTCIKNLTSHLHAIIRTHHFNFDVRFWPISALMSKTIQSKSNSTLGYFQWYMPMINWYCIKLYQWPRKLLQSRSAATSKSEFKSSVTRVETWSQIPRRLPTWVKLQSNKSHCTRRHFFQVAMGNSKDPHQARITWMITDLNQTRT